MTTSRWSPAHDDPAGLRVAERTASERGNWLIRVHPCPHDGGVDLLLMPWTTGTRLSDRTGPGPLWKGEVYQVPSVVTACHTIDANEYLD